MGFQKKRSFSSLSSYDCHVESALATNAHVDGSDRKISEETWSAAAAYAAAAASSASSSAAAAASAAAASATADSFAAAT